MPEQPINVRLMNVDEFIKNHGCLPVTSSFITEPSSSRFHPDGLYSEVIFGAVSSEERLTKFGYIDLNTTVFHPLIFRNIMKLKRFYEDIVTGKAHAVFDNRLGDFILTSSDNPEADTGYEFFFSHFRKIRFSKSGSMSRNDKVDILEKYGDDKVLMSKCLVCPAGIRDYRVDASGRASVEEINKIYNSILNYSKAIPPNLSRHPVFNPIRVSIQRKLEELREYLQNILAGPSGGKEGFLQKKWGSRVVSLSARDVISAASMSALSPDDPKFHKIDETKIPLYLAAKLFEPIVIFKIRQLFFQYIVNLDTEQMSMIDPKTLELEYHTIAPSEKDHLLSSEGLASFISRFEASEHRNDPLMVKNDEGKMFYVYMVYDLGDEIYIFRSIQGFKKRYEEQSGKTFDYNKVRPLTNVEMLSLAAYEATIGKFCAVTRYPVVGIASTYVSRVHLMTTDPARTVSMKSDISAVSYIIPEYPIINNPFVDSVIPHCSRLKGLGGDHDGDTISVHGIMTEEACEECEKYLNDVSSIVAPDRSLVVGGNTDLLSLVLFNFMRPAPKPT